jgi:hypothetical protein
VSLQLSKGYQTTVRKPHVAPKLADFDPRFGQMSKRFQMVGFRGSTEEKSLPEIFRFGYAKAVNDKKVPDPVGSEVFVLQKISSNGSQPKNRMHR